MTAAWLVDDHDLDELLTVSEAATTYHVTEDQVRQWKRRGHLQPAGLSEQGRPLFRGIDVLRAEAKAHRNAARTQAQNLAQRRASRCA